MGAGVPPAHASVYCTAFQREIIFFFRISYRADSDFIDAHLVWAAATRLKVGAEFDIADEVARLARLFAGEDGGVRPEPAKVV